MLLCITVESIMCMMKNDLPEEYRQSIFYHLYHIHSTEHSPKSHPAVHQKWTQAQGCFTKSDSAQQGLMTEIILNCCWVYTPVWQHNIRCGSKAGHMFYTDEQVEGAILTCRSEEDMIICSSLQWNIIIHLLLLRFLITIPVGLQFSPGIDRWHFIFSIFFVTLLILTLKKYMIVL